MKLLIAAYHYPVASARYIADAFERLHVDVRHIGEDQYNNIWGMQVDPKYTWRSHGSLSKSWGDWIPDAVIVADSSLRSYQHPYYSDVKHVVWGVDNHVRDYRAPHIDRYFLAHYHGQVQPVTAEPNSTYLPCAYDPQWFTPSPIDWHSRPFDVCIVGVMYPERVALVEKLRAAGLNVFAATGLLYKEYRDAYWNSKIALCSSAAGDLAQRIFECGAMGCTVLTDPLRDLQDEYTNDLLGLRGFAVYETPDMAVEVAKELTRLDPETGAYGAWRMMTTCNRHTWDSRAQIVIDYLEGREYGLKAPEPMVYPPKYVSKTGMVRAGRKD